MYVYMYIPGKTFPSEHPAFFSSACTLPAPCFLLAGLFQISKLPTGGGCDAGAGEALLTTYYLLLTTYYLLLTTYYLLLTTYNLLLTTGY